MVNILLIILILLLPASSEAAYKIYLKNGSIITGVSSYEKRGEEYLIYYGEGIIGISEVEVLKIEETEAPEIDLRPKETIGKKEEKIVPSKELTVDKRARANALRADLEAINAELKTVQENESRVTASINEKRGRRFKYNIYQLRQLEKEIEPLQQDLYTIQQKKGELLQRKALIEGELRALE